MNWRVILLWSLSGIALAVLGTLGWLNPAWVAFAAWGAVGVCAALSLRRLPRPFLSGFLSGLLMVVLNDVAVYLMWNAYAAHNPETVAQMAEGHPEGTGLPLRLMMLVFAPLNGIICGSVVAC